MLFEKYQVLLIKEKTGSARTLTFRGSYIIALFVLIFGLCAGNLYFMQFYNETLSLKSHIAQNELMYNGKQGNVVAMVSEVQKLKDSLARIQQFNTKLEVMANMEQAEVTPNIGGPNTDILTLGSLPLHRQELATRQITNYLKELETEVKLEEVRQQEILVAMREKISAMASLPTAMPLEGVLTSKFGRRKSPFSSKIEFHNGIDIAAPTGTPIVASGDGIVTAISTKGAYGLLVEINHGSGFTTRYAHLSKFAVKKGDKIKRNQLIGYVGSTGRSTGPHLHYEIRVNGVATNPYKFIAKK